jgi:hypothetical protein
MQQVTEWLVTKFNISTGAQWTSNLKTQLIAQQQDMVMIGAA